ncbi:hypothetical protein BC937DRAFT_89088 [Endogone sp. FLAS-F59071]|nr:hypothetical protein BC937DRAFT_89088 [Endogone sp. FLAS-F59071]|eukprot:RUS18161.1 hypothetical protein BC937DRAFT_89088 [Endogone sp. FLAS-F59071]
MVEAIYILNQPNATSTQATRKYSQHHLKGVLMFMGTKQNHAEEIAALVFNHLVQLHSNVDRYSLDYDSFLLLLRKLLKQFKYSNPKQDIEVSWKIKDRQKSMCGTSGCGKSTLASLLARRVGITTVLSTDNVRHLLRNFHPAESAPVLWASSYHAGESLISPPEVEISADQQVVAGFEAQNEIIFEKLKGIIRTFEKRRECLIVEVGCPPLYQAHAPARSRALKLYPVSDLHQ